MNATTFDPLGPLPVGRVSLDASAGTGKTWTIAALVVRYVAEGVANLDEMLVVTFTRAATAELRDRIRTRLVDTAEHLRAVGAGMRDAADTDDPVLALLADEGIADEERARRLARIEAALADVDAAMISTIHGFAHQVLRSVGFAGDVDGAARLVEDVDDLRSAVGHDLLVELYADEQDDDVLDAVPPVRHVEQVMVERLRHPHARVSPDLDDDAEPHAHELARVTSLVGDQLARAKARRGIMTFDDLLHRLAATLRDERTRTDVLATFRSRFRLALIDEAQDTDPIQWEIIEALFADRTLVLIGDPKQAIYRFRGADVDAYLAGVSRDDTGRFRLDRNHRSDAAYVRAVNTLFENTSFGDQRIRHEHVLARHEDRVRSHEVTAALELRIDPPPARGNARADDARRRIAVDLAAHVARLLASDTTIPDDGAPDGRRRVLARDISILIRSHHTASHLVEALSAADIPHVTTALGSVLEADVADDWAVLLHALATPSNTAGLRALTRTVFMGWTPLQAVMISDDDLDALATTAHTWARILRNDGVASLLRQIHTDTGMGPRLLGLEGGERILTDVEHLGELLHGSLDVGSGPAAMRDWLQQQRQRPATDEIPAEQRARRLETDRDAVNVMTIHAAKGLEFPFVYLPYLLATPKAPSIPFTTTGDDPVLELGGLDADIHKATHKEADHGEYLRLAYVAFTRARHRCVAWWWKASGFTAAPLSKLLLRDEGTPVTAAATSAGVAGMDQRLDDLVARSGGSISWHEIDEDPSDVPAIPVEDESVGDLRLSDFDRELDHVWTRTSYTGLTRRTTHQPDVETADTTSLRHDDDTEDPVVLGASGSGLPLPLAAMRGGAAVGTLVHELYEHLDFTGPDPEADLAARLTARDHGDLGMPVNAIAAGLAATLATPLGGAFGDMTLGDLERRDRRDEMAFELPLAHGGPALSMGSIREVLSSLPDNDPFAGYHHDLRTAGFDRAVRGYLAGFIDLVFRRHTEDGEVFHVVDYKTNVLYDRTTTPTTHDYGHAGLVAGMVRGHYPLQALLYDVALHRWLRARRPDHDPARHIGAIGYLFVRGMVGPSTPVDPGGNVAGVMAWRPPPELVVELSDRLHNGGRT